ncbi:MAG TPA: HNH endonuclease [Bacteroidia bacterium]|nr:HNH endonuclease [Bacteroidia bacterium]
MKFELTRYNQNTTEQELLDDLKRVASDLGKSTVTMVEYDKSGKYSSSTIMKRFGGWNFALDKLGLEKSNHYQITDDELLQNIHSVWVKLGRQPRNKEMAKPISKYGANTYVTRFGSWMKALELFIEYVNNEVIATHKINETKIEIARKHQTKRDINWRLRFLVMRRDNFKCISCGRNPATDPQIILHVDHILAWDKGGETVYENLQTLCSVCNIGKSNLAFKEVE